MLPPKNLSRNGFSALALVISIVAFIAVVAVGISVLTSASKTASKQAAVATPPTNQLRQVLSPAAQPPVVNECTQTLTYASDGNPSPLTCANGDINVTAWNALSAQEPSVMKLGPTATQAQVKAAICADGNVANQDSSASISAPLENSAYQLAAIYNGWHFNLNPIALLTAGGC